MGINSNQCPGTIRMSPSSIRPSVGTENPIPEEMDNCEIAVRVPMMNEVQFLFPSKPCKPPKPRSVYVVFLHFLALGLQGFSLKPAPLDSRLVRRTFLAAGVRRPGLALYELRTSKLPLSR
jgi:hypothetical protein